MASHRLLLLCCLQLASSVVPDNGSGVGARLVRRERAEDLLAAHSHAASVGPHGAVLLETAGGLEPAVNGSRRLPLLKPEKQGCNSCCNDGDHVVPCMDVEACAAEAPASGKRYALVLTHIGTLMERHVPHLASMKAQVDKAKAAGNQMDILMVMKPGAIGRTDEKTRKYLEQHDVKMVPVNWTIPPDMKFTRPENWCGHQDLIRLHVLGLEGYDAVAYYDSDIKLQGDVMAVMRCASTGVLMTTAGGIGEPLNVGFFALKPDQRLLKASEIFAKEANYSVDHGWGASGYKPAGGYYVGAECGQGFFHTLFYQKRSAIGQAALKEVGMGEPGSFLAAQVDICKWNYQTSMFCHGYDCSQVQAHHKPAQKGSDPQECLKNGN